jgi:hypothetical protein
MKFAGSFILIALASCSSGPGPFTPKTKVQRQMVGLVQKFDRWDYNGDGKLTAKELKSAQKISKHTPAQILDFYDTDRSGSITLKEAQAGYERTGEAEQIAKANR